MCLFARMNNPQADGKGGGKLYRACMVMMSTSEYLTPYGVGNVQRQYLSSDNTLVGAKRRKAMTMQKSLAPIRPGVGRWINVINGKIYVP